VTVAEVVVTNVPFGEGPVWMGDGTLCVTSVGEGRVYRVWPDAGRAEVLADTGGGANGAALSRDGTLLVTQNGGVDFASYGVFDESPPYRPVEPGIQRVHADGRVEYLAHGALHAPNDLAVAPDGVLWFTDPGHYPPPDPPVGRVMTMSAAGELHCVADGFWFCNGIAFDRAGRVIVVERRGLMYVNPDGSRDWLIEKLGRGGGDGFCLDVDGRCYVASSIEHGVRIVDPDGTILDFLAIAGDGISTNCCFGGDDLRTLFVTDAQPGQVVAFPSMPTPGLPLPSWPH
jgi:gluconolactonase